MTSTATRTALLAFAALLFLNAVAGAKEEAYVLKNKQGLEAHILPVGAVVQKLLLPDRHGNLDDVILGFATEEPYKDGTSPYFGATIGRVANRIKGAMFELDGDIYHVDSNEGDNCLHGGKDGWSRQAWQMEAADTAEGPGARLTYVSKDGEEGFPGTVSASVMYTLRDDNDLVIQFAAVSDKPTPINMAQHTYFNLDGHKSHHSINGHFLFVNASHYTPVDDEMIPTGEVLPVEDTVFSFNPARRIGERIRHVPGAPPGGYDINYVLFGMDGPTAKARTNNCVIFDKPQPAASIWSPKSGRTLDVLTNSPGLQFYSGNFLNGSIVGKDGYPYPQHGGFALETQVFPNSINEPAFPQCILRPAQQYRHTVIWRFSTKPREYMRRRFKRAAMTKRGRKELPS
ncbi:hypothetical protein WJX72_005126 [[Myrmecia] bisecta]|uniref:Aldose 1-epimerase n=1 Tax=[Myrmecia] bisecta TaxID=41462 RepID=A0AAW1PUE6_9CHLO